MLITMSVQNTMPDFQFLRTLLSAVVIKNGKCSVNELSYMCLDAEDHTTLPQPNLSVRFCRDMPEEFLYRAVEVVSKGRTKPEFFNDEVAIVNLMRDGVSMEDARNYSISGCVEAVPPHCDGEKMLR